MNHWAHATRRDPVVQITRSGVYLSPARASGPRWPAGRLPSARLATVPWCVATVGAMLSGTPPIGWDLTLGGAVPGKKKDGEKGLLTWGVGLQYRPGSLQ